MNPTMLGDNGMLDHEKVMFYSEPHGLVFVFLFFFILFVVAHLALSIFRFPAELRCQTGSHGLRDISA